jgi:hypothetical protein
MMATWSDPWWPFMSLALIVPSLVPEKTIYLLSVRGVQDHPS